MTEHGFNVSRNSRYAALLYSTEEVDDPVELRRRIHAGTFQLPMHGTIDSVLSGDIKTQDFINGGYTLMSVANFGFQWQHLLVMGLTKADFYNGWWDPKTIAQGLRPQPSVVGALMQLSVTLDDLLELSTAPEDFSQLGITMSHLITYFGLSSVEKLMWLDMTLQELHEHLQFSKREFNFFSFNPQQLMALHYTHDWNPDALRRYCEYDSELAEERMQTMREVLARLHAVNVGDVET